MATSLGASQLKVSLYREGSSKGAAVQRELESISRELAIVRSHYHATTNEETVG
jgi:hypothetical protein